MRSEGGMNSEGAVFELHFGGGSRMPHRYRLMSRGGRLRWTSRSEIAVTVLRGPTFRLGHAEILSRSRHETSGWQKCVAVDVGFIR